MHKKIVKLRKLKLICRSELEGLDRRGILLPIKACGGTNAHCRIRTAFFEDQILSLPDPVLGQRVFGATAPRQRGLRLAAARDHRPARQIPVEDRRALVIERDANLAVDVDLLEEDPA